MSSYYIDSGDLHLKIIADNPKEACKKAFLKYKDDPKETLGFLTLINEEGPNKVNSKTLMIRTQEVLKEIGMENKYHLNTELFDEYFRELGEE